MLRGQPLKSNQYQVELVINDRTIAIMARIIELIANLDMSEREDEERETKTARAGAVR